MEGIGNNTGEGREGDKWVKCTGEGRKEGKKGMGMKIQKKQFVSELQ